MGWKGTLKTINAAAKRAAREAERQQKADLKAQMADEAYEAVYIWQERMTDLVSLHKEDVDRINWHNLSSLSKPIAPKPDASNTIKAKGELDHFTPTLRHKVFGGAERKVAILRQKLQEAADKDRSIHRERAAKYQVDLEEWSADTSMANKLLEGDIQAIKDVIDENQTLSDTPLLGESIAFDISQNHVHAKPVVHEIDVVPEFRRKQLASGRLSETKMPNAERMDTYQDYVASAALRVAKEMFAMLPIPEVQVTCYANMLNTGTGHKEDAPILTVQVVRPTFDGLNLRAIDPSDALSNFNHKMNFKRSKGFSKIELPER